MMTGKMIIITDLDGTLLHPQTYSFMEARPALRLIRKLGIPLIFCSSKTRAEISVFRKRLRNSHPFISENGGGIYIPQGYFSAAVNGRETAGYPCIILGTPYGEIRKHFVGLRDRLRAPVLGFGDMTVADIAGLTGLSRHAAGLARQREFDEPFIFTGDMDGHFFREIEAVGLHWTRGRIFHLSGDHDKGKAVQRLIDLFKRQYGPVQSIGLGDSLNDQSLLAAVDRPVLVRHLDGSFDSEVRVPGLLKTRHAGAAGWNEAVLELLGHG
ncbi:MAG: HAD-IIB family hydrolase [Candidatus Aminicenantes bacterium]|nr:HAD-IIB family hydrolase [Candidatus Aminicenantes bacterium]